MHSFLPFFSRFRFTTQKNKQTLGIAFLKSISGERVSGSCIFNQVQVQNGGYTHTILYT